MSRSLFQNLVKKWSILCFGEKVSEDKVQRNQRFLEEALELVQSLGCTEEEAMELVHYVFNRPKGEPHQEVGGTMITLAALCNANQLSMFDAGYDELDRINTDEVIEKIRAKQRTKPQFSALPGVA